MRRCGCCGCCLGGVRKECDEGGERGQDACIVFKGLLCNHNHNKDVFRAPDTPPSPASSK